MKSTYHWDCAFCAYSLEGVILMLYQTSGCYNTVAGWFMHDATSTLSTLVVIKSGLWCLQDKQEIQVTLCQGCKSEDNHRPSHLRTLLTWQQQNCIHKECVFQLKLINWANSIHHKRKKGYWILSEDIWSLKLWEKLKAWLSLTENTVVQPLWNHWHDQCLALGKTVCGSTYTLEEAVVLLCWVNSITDPRFW